MLLYIIEDKFEFMKVLITTEWYEPVVNGVVTSVLNLREELTRQGSKNLYIITNYSGLYRTNRMLNEMQAARKEGICR